MNRWGLSHEDIHHDPEHRKSNTDAPKHHPDDGRAFARWVHLAATHFAQVNRAHDQSHNANDLAAQTAEDPQKEDCSTAMGFLVRPSSADPRAIIIVIVRIPIVVIIDFVIVSPTPSAGNRAVLFVFVPPSARAFVVFVFVSIPFAFPDRLTCFVHILQAGQFRRGRRRQWHGPAAPRTNRPK
jgi:hypothetical protein